MSKEHDDPKISEEKTQRENKITELSRLFSQEEIHNIVKEFIRAYTRGQVTIELALPSHLEYNLNWGALPSNDFIKMSDALNQRNFLKENIKICVGITKASAEEYEKAINNLFEIILILRMTDSMKGTFFLTDIDGRLISAEQKLAKLIHDQEISDKLIRRILDYIERNDPYRERKTRIHVQNVILEFINTRVMNG
jgi:hypothetical protein